MAQLFTGIQTVETEWAFHLAFHCGLIRGGYPPGKPGKVREFDIGQGKVKEIVVCLWCAAAVAIVTR